MLQKSVTKQRKSVAVNYFPTPDILPTSELFRSKLVAQASAEIRPSRRTYSLLLIHLFYNAQNDLIHLNLLFLNLIVTLGLKVTVFTKKKKERKGDEDELKNKNISKANIMSGRLCSQLRINVIFTINFKITNPFLRRLQSKCVWGCSSSLIMLLLKINHVLWI